MHSFHTIAAVLEVGQYQSWLVLHTGNFLTALKQSRSQSSAIGGHFLEILDHFRVLKLEFLIGLGKNSIFKIIMIDGVTLWSKFNSTL